MCASHLSDSRCPGANSRVPLAACPGRRLGPRSCCRVWAHARPCSLSVCCHVLSCPRCMRVRLPREIPVRIACDSPVLPCTFGSAATPPPSMLPAPRNRRRGSPTRSLGGRGRAAHSTQQCSVHSTPHSCSTGAASGTKADSETEAEIWGTRY